MGKSKEKTSFVAESLRSRSRLVTIFGTVAMTLLGCSAICFADFLDDVSSTFQTLTTALWALTPTAAILAYVVAKLWAIFVPEKQGRQEPREWARSVLVNTALIALASTFITFLFNTFGGA